MPVISEPLATPSVTPLGPAVATTPASGYRRLRDSTSWPCRFGLLLPT
jgi:hypothetical protein